LIAKNYMVHLDIYQMCVKVKENKHMGIAGVQ
jgi:hypothetical protein